MAGRRAENLHVEVEFIQQSLVEGDVRGESRPVHSPFGLQVDAVGHRSEVILPLGVGLVIGHHELAALLELFEGCPQLFEQGRTGNPARTVHPQVDTLDPVVGSRRFEGPERLEQRELRHGLKRHDVDPRQRIGRRRIGQHLRKVDLQDRFGVDRHALLHRTGNPQQEENPQEKYEERSHDNRKKSRQKGFYKIHNLLYLYIVSIYESPNCIESAQKRCGSSLRFTIPACPDPEKQV